MAEHGSTPIDELLLRLLKAGSVNLGEIDHGALLAKPAAGDRTQPAGALSPLPHRRRGLQPQHPRREVYDAIRLMKDI